MKVKKYLSLLLAVVMIASVFSTTAFASESELPVNEVIIGGDSLEYRAPNPPTLFYNLGGSGQYTATLIDLAANKNNVDWQRCYAFTIGILSTLCYGKG